MILRWTLSTASFTPVTPWQGPPHTLRGGIIGLGGSLGAGGRALTSEILDPTKFVDRRRVREQNPAWDGGLF